MYVVLSVSVLLCVFYVFVNVFCVLYVFCLKLLCVFVCVFYVLMCFISCCFLPVLGSGRGSRGFLEGVASS